jgi:hypothetical protein
MQLRRLLLSPLQSATAVELPIRSLMRVRHFYLCLCFMGAALPYCWFVPWLAIHGFDLPLFFSELFSTRIGAFFGLDVIISALVLFVFIAVERRRLAIRTWWIPVAATLAVGVSLGLPLFLYLRQLKLDAQSE